jgi:internalin A
MPLVWVGARRETRFGAEYLRKGAGPGACLGLPGVAGACQTAGMSDGFDGERIAEERIAEAARTGQDWLDLGGLGLTRLPEGLFRLTGLRRLNLGPGQSLSAVGWGYDWSRPNQPNHVASCLGRLKELPDLTDLAIDGTDCNDLSVVTPLRDLAWLSCSSTQVSDLAPIAALQTLKYLDCSGSKVSDLTPITTLHALQTLNCFLTQVSDLTPITALHALQTLNCIHTEVSDLAPIAALRALQTIYFAFTRVKDLRPVANLSMLNVLVACNTDVTDLTPLIDLPQLQFLEAHPGFRGGEMAWKP